MEAQVTRDTIVKAVAMGLVFVIPIAAYVVVEMPDIQRMLDRPNWYSIAGASAVVLLGAGLLIGRSLSRPS